MTLICMKKKTTKIKTKKDVTRKKIEKCLLLINHTLKTQLFNEKRERENEHQRHKTLLVVPCRISFVLLGAGSDLYVKTPK